MPGGAVPTVARKRGAMPEIISCPKCDRKLRVPDDLLGQAVKCPTCGATFTAAGAAPEPAAPAAPPPRREPEPDPERSARPRRAAPDDEDDYDDYEDERRPRRRRRY